MIITRHATYADEMQHQKWSQVVLWRRAAQQLYQPNDLQQSTYVIQQFT